MKCSVIGPRMGAFRARLFSTQATPNNHIIFVGEQGQVTPRQNPLLGPADKKYPLPGDVCHRAHFLESQQPSKTVSAPSLMEKSTHSLDALLQTGQAWADRNYLAEQQEQMLEEAAESAADVPVEVVVQGCPKLLKKDLKHLFPHMNLENSSINVLNISQKSEFDQSAWSQEMEKERDILTASFISSAQAICVTLQKCGYWADFIDPSSGRPYLGQFTNSALFETDDAYRQMGFQIEDLGCCKVLKHVLWGSHAFVGTIFTDAPVDSDIVQSIVHKVNASD